MEVSLWMEKETGAYAMFGKDVNPNSQLKNVDRWEYVGCVTLSLSYPTPDSPLPATVHHEPGRGE